MKAIKLDSFPVGNPFHHDYISAGMDLQAATTNPKLKDVYVMGGMTNRYDFYIVNSKTGERIGIKL